MTNAGILGIGTYLPETIRTNGWWPDHVVAKWREKSLRKADGPLPVPMSEGVERVLAAMAKIADDPFNGCLQRRVMKPDELSSEMEIVAARDAMQQANVKPDQIDAVISFTFCPDFACTPSTGTIHLALGLPSKCLAFSMEGACNAFAIQLTLADQLIRCGTARHVLLIQSAAFSKLIPQESPMSPWFGDGATAAIIGPVKEGYGILSAAHGADGTRHHAVVCGVPGKRWYDEGRVVAYSEDPPMAQAIVIGSAERSRYVVGDSLSKAGYDIKDVDFYACHQGMPWLREVTQSYMGMDQARWADTYASFASLSGANVPLVMAVGQKERSLRDGDLVCMFSGGTGETYSALTLRWGRE